MNGWIFFVSGLGVGAGFLHFLTRGKWKKSITLEVENENLRNQIDAKENVIQETQGRLNSTEIEKQKLKESEIRLEEKLNAIEIAQSKLTEHFQALSSDALKSNNQSFLDLAKGVLEQFHQKASAELTSKHQAIDHLMKPVSETLNKFDHKLADLEKTRIGAYEGIKQQVQSLLETQNQLKAETTNLVKALRSPIVRGRWGEIQLKRVVEMAGMLDHCDFFEQQTQEDSEGKRLRPDMIVRLPGEKQVVVDAKAPLASYLEAIEAKDETLRIEKLKDHARQIRDHMTQLSRKSYWDQFQPTPEFVVLFLPGEIFFSAALEQDPSLIEAGVDQRVILATPTTLIALLRAVSYGWRQEGLAKNAKKIAELGQELYKRISDMSGHLTKVGKSLGQAVDSYNKAIGTFETRVMVSARKFESLESAPAHTSIEELQQVEKQPRKLQPSDSMP